MKVQALINYYDKELKRHIKTGEELEVTEERAEVLLKGNDSSKGKPFVEVVKQRKAKAKVEEETEAKEE